MRKLASVFVGLLFSAAVLAGNGSGQTGPNVECELKDGKVHYIPIMICKAEGGKVL